jgi:hypothetical protein
MKRRKREKDAQTQRALRKSFLFATNYLGPYSKADADATAAMMRDLFPVWRTWG